MLKIKRLLDLLLSITALIIFAPILLAIIILVRATSKGPAIHWSKRVGKNNQIFLMPKIRSMYIDAPQLATDLMNANAKSYVTPVGRILRKTSLDELPQIWSVVVGDMSIVGPRPALFNQYNLIELRTKNDIHKLQPGITGWAQINGRDLVTDEEKTALDAFYLHNKSILLDIKIIALTFIAVIRPKNITH